MQEVALQFGPQRNLMGMLTLPDTHEPADHACLLFNAGVIHRIGPHRYNVKLARTLAAQGTPCLRMDLSGLGDSPTVAGAAQFREQAVLDLQAAMDMLEQTRGIHRFIIFGLCSGAVNGYATAIADPRVTGLMMFDGFVFPTFKTHLIRRWTRLRALTWPQAARRVASRLLRLFHRSASPGSAAAGLSWDESTGNPSRAGFSSAMDALDARGVALYMVYSGSFIERHNYAGQLRDAFGGARFMTRLRQDYLPDVDHTITSLASQRKVTDLICAWMRSIASTPPAAQSASGSTRSST